ncbi:STAS domain-containing protein [Butyrivibrio sp. AE2032]|jgi:anti-sigma B factor antagonist|uniref:STAS domain-containing protein n=1 Tax=Butyrivibrio sp. AE2032 TaxID=1458463 RepID=UPI000556FA47|nr:STAS domain-containing protein [Butyrivibrio sp. AE2032]
MKIKTSESEKEIVIALEGWLDTQATPELTLLLEKLELDDRTLVLDLKDLEYISSSGVRQVVFAHKKANGNFVVRNTPENIFNVFSATGIDKRVNFE